MSSNQMLYASCPSAPSAKKNSPASCSSADASGMGSVNFAHVVVRGRPPSTSAMKSDVPVLSLPSPAASRVIGTLDLAQKVSALNAVRSLGTPATNAPPAKPPVGSPGAGTSTRSEDSPFRRSVASMLIASNFDPAKAWKSTDAPNPSEKTSASGGNGAGPIGSERSHAAANTDDATTANASCDLENM